MNKQLYMLIDAYSSEGEYLTDTYLYSTLKKARKKLNLLKEYYKQIIGRFFNDTDEYDDTFEITDNADEYLSQSIGSDEYLLLQIKCVPIE